MLRLSLVVFAVGNFLLPWASRITGSIDEQLELESGSGINDTGMGGYQDGYCGFNYTREAVNENSVKRFPPQVWAIVLLITLLIILGRQVPILYNYMYTATPVDMLK